MTHNRSEKHPTDNRNPSALAAEPSRMGAPISILTGLTIALVDDEPTVLRALTMLLQALKATPLPYSSGVEAYEFLLSKPDVNLVLSDLRMPNLSGMQLLRRLRSVGIFTPFLLMSGHATPSEAAETETAGRAAFLAKPFTPPHLASAVARLLPHAQHQHTGYEVP
jgi:DNA-binding NtrC family response regulator